MTDAHGIEVRNAAGRLQISSDTPYRSLYTKEVGVYTGATNIIVEDEEDLFINYQPSPGKAQTIWVQQIIAANGNGQVSFFTGGTEVANLYQEQQGDPNTNRNISVNYVKAKVLPQQIVPYTGDSYGIVVFSSLVTTPLTIAFDSRKWLSAPSSFEVVALAPSSGRTGTLSEASNTPLVSDVSFYASISGFPKGLAQPSSITGVVGRLYVGYQFLNQVPVTVDGITTNVSGIRYGGYYYKGVTPSTGSTGEQGIASQFIRNSDVILKNWSGTIFIKKIN